MISSNKAYLVGFILALTLYIVSIVALTFTFIFSEKNSERFTAQDRDFLDVVLVDSPRAVVAPPKVDAPVGSQSPKQAQTPDLQNLFSKIDTTKLPPKEEPKQTPPTAPPSRLKGITQDTQVSNITSILDGINTTVQADYKASSTAQYDEYKGKIVDILDKYWQSYMNMQTPGPEADVDIVISSLGDLSYNVKRTSKNDEFNQILFKYLEDMKKIKFPINTDGKSFRFNTKFNIKTMES